MADDNTHKTPKEGRIVYGRTNEGYDVHKKRITMRGWRKNYGYNIPLEYFEEFKTNKAAYMKAVTLDRTLLNNLCKQYDTKNNVEGIDIVQSDKNVKKTDIVQTVQTDKNVQSDNIDIVQTDKNVEKIDMDMLLEYYVKEKYKNDKVVVLMSHV